MRKASKPKKPLWLITILCAAAILLLSAFSIFVLLPLAVCQHLCTFSEASPAIYLILMPSPPQTLDFTQIDEVIIKDNWQGLSPRSPQIIKYVMKRELGQFSGEANFSIGWRKSLITNVPIKISFDDVQSFLTLLSQSQLEKGIYSPEINHTDDYPEIEIILLSQTKEIARFFTTSQGESHTPWEVTVNGNSYSYVDRSEFPARALQKIKENLHPEVLQSLIDQAEK